MRFDLKPELRPQFEDRLETLGDWFHSYAFGDSIYTGFYKAEGLYWGSTWCNSRSKPELIAALRAAYERRDLAPWRETVFSALKRCDIDPAKSSVLDLSSASGRNSFFLADYGFSRVIASEIRELSHRQHRLILDSITNEDYARRTTTINDSISADAAEFPDRYIGENIDVVCSFGLLYHLGNPMQHLINLRRIARRYVLIFTKTQLETGIGVNGRRGWMPTIEKTSDIANAAFGFGWTPHYFELPRAAEQVGLDLIGVDYPAPFAENFPYFRARPREIFLRRALESATSRLLGRPIGHVRNMDQQYGGRFHLNPGYFMYTFKTSDRGVRYG
jgi:SAM-dependent methyltransferase